MVEDDSEGGEAWSDILARRSPEGRAVVIELNRAEQAVLTIQARIMAALTERQDCQADFEAMKEAMAEVDRMRKEVYRMARD